MIYNIFKETMTKAKVDRSILQGESIEIFRAAIKSPATTYNNPYERRLINFLKMISLTPDYFIDLAKKILFLLKGR
jgi:hypothetical protein